MVNISSTSNQSSVNINYIYFKEVIHANPSSNQFQATYDHKLQMYLILLKSYTNLRQY